MLTLLHDIRRWITAQVTDAALAAAPVTPAALVDATEALLARVAPRVPVLGRIVAENLRSAQAYSTAAHRAYFRQVAAHLSGALHIFRQRRGASRPATGPAPASDAPPALVRITRQRVQLDASFERLRTLAQRGRGVIVMNAHTCNYLLAMTRLNLELPITVVLRPSRRAQRGQAKRDWCALTGVRAIAEVDADAGPMRRLARMSEVLRGGGVLIISPDLPQKCGAGVPVRLFERTVFLPGGAGVLALRTGAPVMTLFARPSAGADHALVFGGPLELPHPAARRDRDATVGRVLQFFADGLEHFARAHPQLWYMWGDKRWTRVFRNDPRYAAPRCEVGASGAAAEPLAPALER